MAAPLDPREVPTLPPTSLSETPSLTDAATLPPAPAADPNATQHFENASVPTTTPWPCISGYEILGELGRGGMGVVYKARQEKVNRLVALKMVLGSSCASPEARLRFLLEGEVLGRLQHPHIVQIYEVGTWEGQPYFALEYVEGGTLADTLKQHPPTPTEAAALIEQLARAVHYAHSNGVIHRDLKPANILLTLSRAPEARAGGSEARASGAPLNEWFPKITDFGLAKQTQTGTGLTASGAVMGTPAYMAPEQAEGKGKQVTAATDVYALGAILYELLAGRPPFVAPSPLDVILKVVSEEPPSVSSLKAKLPPDLVTICHKCLQKEPDQRYPTAEALADDLRRFLDDRPIHARPVKTPERVWRWCRRNPVVAGLGLMVFLSMALGTIIATLFAQDAREKERLAVEEKEATRQEKERADLERNAARRLLGLQAVREGIRAADQGDLFTALLWFTEPMVRDPDNPETALVARRRIANYRHYTPAPTLSHVLTHQGRVVHASFDQNGHCIVLLAQGKSVQGWDVMTGKPCTPVLPHDESVYFANLSPDRQFIVTVAFNMTVRIWDAKKGLPRFAPIAYHPDRIIRAIFSPDGNSLVIFGGSGAQVWNMVTGAKCSTLAHDKSVYDASYSPDGRWLITAHADATAQVWDITTGRPLNPPLVHQEGICCCAFSPNGRWVATASSDDRTAQVWDAMSGQPSIPPLTHQGRLLKVVFSPDGRWIATVSSDKTARIWDVLTGRPRTPPLIHRGGVTNAVFSPDGRWLVTTAWDQTAQVWDGLLDTHGHPAFSIKPRLIMQPSVQTGGI